jgi:DNA-binding NtrC family response regulator
MKAMFPEPVILVVQGDSPEAESIAKLLSEQYRVIGAERPQDALMHSTDGVDLVVSELEAADFAGVELLRAWKARQPATPFLMVTDGRDVRAVVEAMKLGAADCIVKPFDPGTLRAAVARLLKGSSAAAATMSHDVANFRGHKAAIEIPPGTSLEDLERAAVEQALAQHHGNRTHAAKTLGISVRTLQRKLKAWGMPISGPQNSSNSPPASRFLLSAHTAPASFSAHVH